MKNENYKLQIENVHGALRGREARMIRGFRDGEPGAPGTPLRGSGAAERRDFSLKIEKYKLEIFVVCHLLTADQRG